MREILRFSVALPLLLLLAAGSCLASDAVDDLITKEMSRRKIPGVSVAVLREGRVAKMQGYGVATIERGERVEPETLFEIGSITKQFTAALIMMLVEEAKLRLDDRITQYFPGTPDEWKSITIRHLLTHTSGIPNYTTLEGFEVSRHLTSEQFVRALAAHPLRFTPGAKFAYCNSGYNLLGFIIEKVSHDSFWNVLQRRIFGPLRMTASHSRDLPDAHSRAEGYEKKRNDLVRRDSNLTDIFSAGAIVSSVKDLVQWARAIDSASIVSRSALQQMWSPVKLNDGSSYPYGFGWRLEDFDGRRNIGHSGSTSGFSASLQRFPDYDLTVIVLCNLGEEGVATSVARMVAEIVTTPRKKAVEAGK